jgi:glycine/D-amino acid oxidase-like deaminating enzyme
MTLSVWLDQDSSQLKDVATEYFDLVIVGGGVIGTAFAYYAQKHGHLENLKVLLLESGSLASGASGRNGGFVLRGIHTYYDDCIKEYGRETARSIYSFGEANQALMRQFIEEHQVDVDYLPSGSLILASSLEEFEQLSRSAKLMREDGFALEIYQSDPLDRGFYGAIFNGGDFGVHPVKLVRALRELSAVTVSENEMVRRIEAAPGGAVSLTTASRQIIAGQVFLATNAYSGLLHPYFQDKISPARGQMIATSPLKKKILNELCYANFGWEYFRQLPDKRLILGGCRQLFIEEEKGYQDTITHGLQQALEHYLKVHFPELAGVGIDYRWSGLMAFTEDGLPLVGELEAVPGVYFAVGCNGHGMGYSLKLASSCVDLVFKGGSEALSLFDAGRLAASGKSNDLVALSEESPNGRKKRLTVSDVEGP